jgi:C1A family cysteine protease
LAQLKAAVAKQPVVIALDADYLNVPPNPNYIIDENVPCSDKPNHAVLIVGYEKNYFIVKNSWG